MKKTILALSMALFVQFAHAGEPIKSTDALESELTECLMKSNKTHKCMETILGKRILPGNDQIVPIAKQMDELLRKWLADESIYAIHPIRSKKTGDIYDMRTYLIEDTSGSLMVFNLATLKRLGKWYVFQFNLTSTSSEITSALKGE